jgi:hypothetical protein
MRSRRTNRAAISATAIAAVLGLALGATPASAATAAAHHGYEQFRISTHTIGARRDYVRGIGVLNARGSAVPSAVVSGHGTVRLEFRTGSIVLRLTVVSTSVSVPNPATCTFTETNRGTFRVSRGSGSYRGATGSGRLHTRIRGRLAKSGGVCTATLAAYGKYQTASGLLSW